MQFKVNILHTDLLIIGGGTAGCFSALTAAEQSDCKIMIVEKANIKRSGCLAAGVNALNAYIGEDETPESFVEYVKQDSEGVIREDLVYSIAKRLNTVTKKMEELGLPILKDENGNYVQRGRGSIKINGENIKPLLSEAVYKHRSIEVLNKVNMIDYLVHDREVIGAIGFSIEEPKFIAVYAKAVICTTGGAAGLYKPNNPGFSGHKMWYSPFNAGAGYAMGIRAGAEMTSFEMRFIALRCKDTIAPTGTVAQGVKVKQVNKKGETYVRKYGEPTTPMRLYATLMENENGNGPCYLQTKGITKEQEQELYKAYLNMAPAQTLQWLEHNTGPASQNIEIQGTEPYIVGGHTASGYWIDRNRKTTLKGLYAAGDVAGGSPKKYVTGCFVEGEIAALAAVNEIQQKLSPAVDERVIQRYVNSLHRFFENGSCLYEIEELEIAMQKIMDEYAGGISQQYAYSEQKLIIAAARMDELMDVAYTLQVKDLHELLFIHEIIDRLYVGRVLIEHLKARKETRWKCYQENKDYPEKDDANWKKYVNSIYGDGKVNILYRDLIERDEAYEHSH